MASAALQLGESRGYVRQDHSRDLPNRLHALLHSSPSSPKQHGAEDMGEAIGTNPRKSAGSYEDRSETRTSLHRALKLHVNDPAKIAARKTGASVDTIDNHLAGNVPQSWAQMIAYCRAYPGFGLEVMELMGLDIDRDRESYAEFLSLQKRIRGQ